MAQHQATKRDEAAADNIAGNSRHALSSDEFLSEKDVQAQLDKLAAYITAKRETRPTYAIPKPIGWRLQVLMLTAPEESAGGVHLPGDVIEAHTHKTVQGVVIGMGSTAYMDRDKFGTPDGQILPWCKLGDRLQLVRYDASQFQLANGQWLGTVNDTSPLSVIDNWEVPANV